MINGINYLAIKILGIATISFILSCSSNNLGHEEKEHPNIIFILTDDQGWTHVSHRANPNIPESKSDYYETPNMDRLARSGIVFTNGYAPNPICSPTRNSLMFGQNAARHIYNQNKNWYKNTSDWLTIPRVIKLANPEYRTAHFGKWHIAMEPSDAGFDVHDGMTSNSEGDIFGEGYLDARDYAENAEKFLVKNKVENPTHAKIAGKPSAYWSDENPKDIFGITSRAKEFMKKSIVDGRPFYVQLSHYAPHLALVSQNETYEYFKNKEKGERHTNPEFAAMLKDLDTSVGMIMEFVKDQGIGENTYIFLMGDNGGRLSLHHIAIIDENKQLVEAEYSTQHNRNIPLRDGKHSFYEGGLRVPYMVSGPGIKPDRISNVPVTGLDLLPTFARLVGYDKDFPEIIDGGNLTPVLINENINYVERNDESLIFHQGAHRKPRSAIIEGDYKLIKYWIKETKYEKTPKIELYNITEDLSESNNLVEILPKKANELETELLTFLTRVNAETEVVDIQGPFFKLRDELLLQVSDSPMN